MNTTKYWTPLSLPQYGVTPVLYLGLLPCDDFVSLGHWGGGVIYGIVFGENL
jgi:hypothetical protein